MIESLLRPFRYSVMRERERLSICSSLLIAHCIRRHRQRARTIQSRSGARFRNTFLDILIIFNQMARGHKLSENGGLLGSLWRYRKHGEWRKKEVIQSTVHRIRERKIPWPCFMFLLGQVTLPEARGQSQRLWKSGYGPDSDSPTTQRTGRETHRSPHLHLMDAQIFKPILLTDCSYIWPIHFDGDIWVCSCHGICWNIKKENDGNGWRTVRAHKPNKQIIFVFGFFE